MKRSLCLLGLCLAVACAAEVPDLDTEETLLEVDSVEQQILAGWPLDPMDALRSGFVMLHIKRTSDGPYEYECNGTLYTNRRMATAEHCFTGSENALVRANPSWVQVTLGTGSNRQIQFARTIYFTQDPENDDLAVIEVSAPFTMIHPTSGLLSSTGYSRSFIVPADGTRVLCVSAGRDPSLPEPNDATYRYGFWRTTHDDRFFHYTGSEQGQFFVDGDSGSGCVLDGHDLWAAPLVSVFSGRVGLDFGGEPAVRLTGATLVPAPR